jgi:hypothetical protein
LKEGELMAMEYTIIFDGLSSIASDSIFFPDSVFNMLPIINLKIGSQYK